MSSTSAPNLGEAAAVTLLLSDWSNFGLTERVCYHVDLFATLTEQHGDTTTTVEDKAAEAPAVIIQDEAMCGVVGILECVPRVVPRYHRRSLKNAIRNFNAQARKLRNERSLACYEPQQLPLPLSPSTRLSFAYEITKIAFCLDASPSLVSTFGEQGSNEHFCCALDRLSGMVRTFFRGLVEPVRAPFLEESRATKSVWRPIVAVTVVAVFPKGTGPTDTRLLVRDFRVHDEESAECLARNISKWATGEIEDEIMIRLSRGGTAFSSPHLGYDTWKFSTYSSSLKDILDAGDAALSLLPSHARPSIVVATDCRSVVCDQVLDVFADKNRVDTPLVVLDLSSPTSHQPDSDLSTMTTDTTFLTMDNSGDFSYPLHLSDDSEQLFAISRATGGCFMDGLLLEEAVSSYAGTVQVKSDLASDQYFSFRRRTLKLNGVQNYVLLSLSPLSPLAHPAWGKLVAPQYLRDRLGVSTGKQDMPVQGKALGRLESGGSFARSDSGGRSPFQADRSDQTSRTIMQKAFSTYVVSPVPIKSLLLMRIKEGYRVKQYGQSTQDSDKISLQLTLPLELGNVVHYELSFTSLRGLATPTVGTAHVKIELSGEAKFIQSVKNDFLSNVSLQTTRRPTTLARKASEKLCKNLRSLRREDHLHSYLCPLSWKDKFSGPQCPFARRLGTLSNLQRRGHFRMTAFDVVCVGRMPYERDEKLLLSEFVYDSGENELAEALSDWALHEISEKRRYVKKMESGLVDYCVVEVIPSKSASRLFTILVETFGVGSAGRRLDLIGSLHRALSSLSGVRVLRKQMDEYLVGLRNPRNPTVRLVRRNRFLESHFHHESWDGVKDPELLPLLTRRRGEVGEFWFLHASDLYALFAKLVCVENGRLVTADISNTVDSSSSDLYQVQYQISVLEDKVVIDMHVEREQGVFFVESAHTNLLLDIFDRVKRHDQECGKALRSRTNLLRIFGDPSDLVLATVGAPKEDSYVADVESLLKYASQDTRKLRFFRPDGSGANKELEMLLSESITTSSLAMNVSKLPIGESVFEGYDIGEGLWFLVQFDWHTTSIVHLSTKNLEHGPGSSADIAFRDLTFFTIGVSDLYCKRDVVADDDSSGDHISEYMCVSEFADSIEASHGKNYAKAAYLALRSDRPKESLLLDPDDLQFALGQCSFVQAATVTLSDPPVASEGRSLLSSAMNSFLQPVPGNDYYLFLSVDKAVTIADGERDLGHEIEYLSDESESVVNEEHRESEDDESASSSTLLETSEQRFQLSSDNESESIVAAASYTAPPVFARFTVDGNLISFNEIDSVDEGKSITAYVSTFTNEEQRDGVLPKVPLDGTQRVVAVELQALLDSYVAEQTLDRLLFLQKPSEADLRVVTRSMAKSRSVLVASFNLEFYSAGTDQLRPSSALSGGEAEIEMGFSLLETELQSCDALILTIISPGRFVVDKVSDPSLRLKFWCFLTVKKSQGAVVCEVYHPGETSDAEMILNIVREQIESSCRRVNQQLMLRSLHRNRTASIFLIPEDVSDDAPDSPRNDEIGASSDDRAQGSFACPIQFSAKYSLFHRCSVDQAIISLEASVLHSLALLNRRNFFVYKDESENIFYLTLKGNSQSTASSSVEFLVYGLRTPGQSLKQQLNTLLGRHLLTIGVDALSAVLSKNPNFNWKMADIQFVRSFRDTWEKLDVEKQQYSTEGERTYALPFHAYDPIMLLVYFRQNLCGSTFFHPLHETALEEDDRSLSLSLSDDEDTESSSRVPFDRRDFLLYYNNAPSPLDPALQPVSTLTSKGEQYSRETGNGIAVIEIDLLHANGVRVGGLSSGEAKDGKAIPEDLKMEALRVQRNGTSAESTTSSFLVQVRIIDTVIDCSVLHDWILLSLNQVLAAWSIEHHLHQSDLFRLSQAIKTSRKTTRRTAQGEEFDQFDSVVPGFRLLRDMLDCTFDLPHPAIERICLDGMIRSPSVSAVAVAMLDVIVAQLRDRKPNYLVNINDICVLRCSRLDEPQIVRISTRENKTGTGRLLFDQSVLKDGPIECPEYLCLFIFGSEQNGTTATGSQRASPPMLFGEVMLGDESLDRKSGMTEALLKLKEMRPEAFGRSFMFILSIKRNRRLLWTYNWNPQTRKSVITRLKDVNSTFVGNAGMEMHVWQQRCLRFLSPPTVKRSPAGSTKNKTASFDDPDSSAKKADETGSTTSGTEVKSAELDQAEKRRTITRPTIRRPTLKGKSTEGAAVQAIAASRARASAGSRLASRTGQQKSPRGLSTRGNAPGRTPNKISPKPVARKSPEGTIDKPQTSIIVPFLRQFAVAKPASPWSLNVLPQSQQALFRKLWSNVPEQENYPLVCQFLLSRTTPVWSAVCDLLVLPRAIADDFSRFFKHWLVFANRGLVIVKEEGTGATQTPKAPSSDEFLVIELKKTKRVRLCVAIRIRCQRSGHGAKSSLLCDAWSMILPSDGKVVSKKRNKRHNVDRLERTAGLIDKKVASLNEMMNLERQVFNFSAFLVERYLQAANVSCSPSEVLPLLHSMMERYSIQRQHDMSGLRYNVLQATIVLKSYENVHIDRFDALTLFDHLLMHANAFEMSACGDDGIWFDEQILECDMVSRCCLTRQSPPNKTKLQLVLLCRTEGRSLNEYTFRKGSPVAVTVLDKIVVAAARLARDALQAASIQIYRHRLWNKLSSPKLPHYTVTNEDLAEMLALQIPLVDESASMYAQLFAVGVNWHGLARSMSKEPSFAPHRTFKVDSTTTLYLSYLSSLRLFLVLKVSDAGKLVEATVLTMDTDESRDKHRRLATQMLVNFLIHYTWQTL